ncbi:MULTISPECIES: rRNA maturation RNase YbeY [Helicobacter]|uniref:Endoribonuclease YbeY n=1 Tax=Helicobacter ibis TaxID=2962633 RepID=A0ABT4VFZ2_9HELI|nr:MULTISPECIES: rRNA maturation RNase YbeY [Helicobacter]MDA3967961.1 rRNA maturation RNase YbeY [Helicobacter sp. WB40]MDA3969629.1 rRNA maturation RNase YbeY [Helicobacter ibis]
MCSVDFDNQTNFSFSDEFLATIHRIFCRLCSDLSLEDKTCELLIVSNQTIQELNREYRQKDMATDVLSFPLLAEASVILGSIVISLDYARSGAEKFGHSIEDEIFILFIHGVLHLLGYDHEVDNGEQREKEKEIIETFNLPASLIVREM